MNETDADRLELLDRVKARIPELDLDQHTVEWTELPDDGSQALVLDGGGFDGGPGAFIASAGDDLHVIGSMAPIVDGALGCIVVAADGTRRVVRVMPDPLAQQERAD
jgi:hypothetical protein